ncbi:pimeloyl-ACP methyl ester carboxylesterase [Lewinella aquimaris]|uniref:Pimeloyl-ACP methyl ester carboxylesterase n=1 Tax=Neolewinella aquimaris TaxID=1835722 RepID=A0A840EBP7_9BACT|nr:alpha/beta hydrolase [Neolewinella aquimaris]MBB4080945.1 pimeloyl-ACP methyl ester carboxylesterase [Neolewinella aquimaris]
MIRSLPLLALFSCFLLPTTPLAAQSTTAPEQWYNFTDDGHQMFVYEVGQGPDTIVVLHGGWGAEHSYLLEPLAPLADRYRLVFYDQRGSLRSPAPDSTIRIDRLVEDLDDLRRSLQLAQLTLVTHSMGAALAYAYLAKYPERVRALVMSGAVHPVPFKSVPDMEYVREVWPQADSLELAETSNEVYKSMRIRAVEQMRAEGMVPDSLADADPLTTFRTLFAGSTDREYTRRWRIFFTAVNSCDVGNWRNTKGGMAFYSQAVADAILADTAYADQQAGFWPALKNFAGPVRVIYGTCDYVDPGAAIWQRTVAHLNDGELYVVEGAGHGIWSSHAKEYARVIREALGDF